MTSTDWCSKGLGSSQGPPSSLQVNCHPDMSGLIVDRQAADSLAHRAPSEPAPMVRQSLGSPSPQETGPACTGAPFTHTHTERDTHIRTPCSWRLGRRVGVRVGQGRPQELQQRSPLRHEVAAVMGTRAWARPAGSSCCSQVRAERGPSVG